LKRELFFIIEIALTAICLWFLCSSMLFSETNYFH
jgi:hypothetical protein